MHALWTRSCVGLLLLAGCVDYGVIRKADIDSFLQPPREGGVDVLWVIDGSFSMDEEKVQLGSHAATFITFLSTAPVDFQLGVTTTDAAGGGALLGPMLTAQTDNLSGAFVDQVTSVGDGDRTEQGFGAALAAASRA